MQQLWFDLGEHRSVHRPRVVARIDDSNGVSVQIYAEGIEGWRELITEIRIPRTDLVQAWERAHVRMHGKSDQETAKREHAFNVAQWGERYGLIGDQR